MEQIIAFLIVYIMICVIQSLPIENGFNIRFNPSSLGEDFRTKRIGRKFTKVPEDFEKPFEDTRRDVFTHTFLLQPAKPMQETTQVNKLSTPKDSSVNNDTEMLENHITNFLNLPVFSQPYADYKILVAAAPPNVNLGSGAEKKKIVIYVVFPDISLGDFELKDMPKIFFVNEKTIKKKHKKELEEPILIIDNNRTVTGLKSKEIAKFLKFRNKHTNRFNYKVTR